MTGERSAVTAAADSELILCNVSVAPLSFRDVVTAASAAGFDGISILGRSLRRARTREGLSDSDIRAMLADNGLVLTEIEAVGDWLTPPPVDQPAFLDQVLTEAEYLQAGGSLGAKTLVATHFGDAVELDEAAEKFAGLCDRAADHGLDVALEAVAWATISDIGTAWEIAHRADRRNAGILVDAWHHNRGPGAGDADLLRRIPADRVFAVQLSDAAVTPVGPPLEDVQHRLLPGAGGFDLAGLLGILDDARVRAPIGVEVLNAEILAQGPAVAGRILMDALRATLDRARL
ncbi:sugar phosphate isomerase/epimerase [Frankia sp. CiP3]|uniref:sugar phosphate isomerase/epimerase family protein n=1 Tax=Frankia sp. CiP3 TaxID=2880971 RepID=UPI001EF5A04D|nr:sugar phosphate isomerase/epimerase family protein [Frankia sp. CiP3]